MIGLTSNIKSVNKLFEESFRRNWMCPALSDYGGETLTYGQLATRIAWLHLFFKEAGIRKGDKIAICSRNQIYWAVTYLATVTYGAVAVPILHEFKPANVAHLVEHSEAKLFFVGGPIWENLQYEDFSFLDAVIRYPGYEIVLSNKSSIVTLRNRIDSKFEDKYSHGYSEEDIDYFRDRPSDLALISYTSGTSGFSKGVMIPFRALLSNILFATEVEPQMDNTSNMLSILPTAHMFGMMFEFLFEMTIGAHVHFLTRLPSPRILLEAFSKVKPDVIITVPIIVEKLYKNIVLPAINKGAAKLLMNIPVADHIVLGKINGRLKEAFGGRFKEVIIGGAPFSREAEQLLSKMNFPYTVGYGMTECAPIVTFAPSDCTRLYSCGKPAPRMSVRIDSRDPLNIPGEILIKGDNVFAGYYKNEKATKSAFTRDGWFHTGDVGVFDLDGYLYIKGRKKSMILGPSGQNIYPEEIESVIDNMEEVTESLVIEDNGLLVAMIYPDIRKMNIEQYSQSEIDSMCRELLSRINSQLPKYSRIAAVELVPEEFEKTPKHSIKRYLYQR